VTRFLERLPGNRRLHVAMLGLAVLVALAAVVALAHGGDDARPPAGQAARLVPAGALVFVHLSTDPARPAVGQAQKLAARFPGFARMRDALLHRLSAPRCGADVRRLKGREAALALLDGRGGTAGSLVLVDTGRRSASAPTLGRGCGGVSVGRIGTFLVIGQPETLRAAQALARGDGKRLSDDPLYRRTQEGLPAGRVADGYASADGVRRLLAPQGGVLGAAGVLLDSPALRGVGFGLTPARTGADLRLHSVLDPAIRKRTPLRTFEPSLAGAVPPNAIAYLGVSGISDALGRLGSAAGAGSSSALGGLLKATAPLARRLQAVFSGEVAIVVTPALPAPILSVVAKADDEAKARVALANLQAPLERLFAPKGNGGGQAPTFDEKRVAGVQAFSLNLAPGVQIDYAVFDKKIVLSTQLEGIRQVKEAKQHLSDDSDFKAVLADHPKSVSSLVFLDFSQLLRLGEQTGLNNSQAYLKVKQDLQTVRAIGASSTGGNDDSTAEIHLSIP
jgi:Protein of unknown function (DUF3352)